MGKGKCNIPFDGKAGDPRLLGENVALDPLDDGLSGGLGAQLFRIVLIVHVVANSHEFAAVVGTGEEDHGDAENIRVGNPLRIGRLCLERELAHTDGDRSHEQGIEFLIILITAGASIGGASDSWTNRERR